MKQLNILILIMLITSSCQREKRVDLASININEKEIEKLLSEPGTFERGMGDIMWGYPDYVTYEMEKFRWGDYKFISSDYCPENCVEIIRDSTDSYPVIMQIRIFEEDAKRAAGPLLEEIRSQYGEPVVLHEMTLQTLQHTSYLWKDTKEDQSLLFHITYSGYTPRPINGLTIYTIKNKTDIVVKGYDNNDMNILDYFIRMHSLQSDKKREWRFHKKCDRSSGSGNTR